VKPESPCGDFIGELFSLTCVRKFNKLPTRPEEPN
jgi:hypothetical protein